MSSFIHKNVLYQKKETLFSCIVKAIGLGTRAASTCSLVYTYITNLIFKKRICGFRVEKSILSFSEFDLE